MKILERDGWLMTCPFCGKEIRYTLINNQGRPVPFYYAEKSNDVLLRKSDERLYLALLEESEGQAPSILAMKMLWSSILRNAPPAPSGGTFSLWANVKCPHCKQEIPYNKGIKDIALRLYEPRIVLIDDSVLLGDNDENTWRIKVRLPGSA